MESLDCLSHCHLLHHNLEVFLINHNKSERAMLFNDGINLLRLQHHRGENARLFRLGGIIADPVPAAWSLIEALASSQHLHRLVVHLVENGAGEHVHGDRGAVVGVRWRAGSGRESDFEADDAFVGGVEEFVLVYQF